MIPGRTGCDVCDGSRGVIGPATRGCARPAGLCGCARWRRAVTVSRFSIQSIISASRANGSSLRGAGRRTSRGRILWAARWPIMPSNGIKVPASVASEVGAWVNGLCAPALPDQADIHPSIASAATRRIVLSHAAATLRSSVPMQPLQAKRWTTQNQPTRIGARLSSWRGRRCGRRGVLNSRDLHAGPRCGRTPRAQHGHLALPLCRQPLSRDSGISLRP